MIRRTYSILFLVGAIIFAGASVASAQIVITSGMVEMTKADGTRGPVADAVVEAYKGDGKAGSVSTKTGKNGIFRFAGLQFGFPYTLVVSAAGAQPTYIPGIQPGSDKLLISMTPGDGRRLTEAEVREGIALSAKAGVDGNATGELTAEQKKQKAESEAEIAKVKAKNEKAVNVNQTVNRVLKEGAAALDKKEYDVAIAKFTEGYDVEPGFVGTAPVMLMYRGSTLRRRGVENFNANAKNTDATAKREAHEKVKADFVNSLDDLNRSYLLIKNAPAAEIPDAANAEKNKQEALREARETIRLMVLTELVGDGAADTAAALLPEISNLDADAAKKNETLFFLGELYRVRRETDKAVEAYKSVLAKSPDNVDALAGVGLVLVDAGWSNGDKTKSQEGANFLQKFVSIAPDSHKMKEGAVAYLEQLKKESIIPVKTPGGKKRN